MAQAIGNADRGCGTRGSLFAFRPEQARKAGRTDDDGHGHPPLEQGHRQIAFCSAIQRLRHKIIAIEGGLVAPQGVFVLGTAVGKIEDRAGQGRTCHLAQG